ncbi:MAG: ywfM-like transporter [Frankiales bacterium]|nr:ywfM-like transporter [Frankiales bacterium]
MTAAPATAPPARSLGSVPAPLLVLVAIASVQCGSAVARGVFDDLGAAGITLLRLGLASLLLLVVLRPRVRSWSAQAWRAAALLGAVMGGMNLVFYLSIRTVPLGIAVTVEFVGPLLLALVQTRRAVDLLWALLAAGGVVLLGAHTSKAIPLSGLVLALIAGMFWAAYILASAHVGRTLPGTDGLPIALAVGTLLVLPFGARGASAVFDRPALLVPALGVAVLSSVLAYGLELSALRRIPTRVFGILMSLEPAAAAISGLLFLSQRLHLREVTALVMVSAASAGVTLARRDDAVPAQPLE